VNKTVFVFDDHGIIAVGRGVFVSLLSIPSKITRFKFSLEGKKVHLNCIEFANGTFAADFTHDGRSMTVLGQIDPADEDDYDYD
jgi:hypothetical protein